MAQAQSGGRGFHATAAKADDLIECFVNGEPVQVAKGSNVMAACSAAGVDVRPPPPATSLLASIFRMCRMQFCGHRRLLCLTSKARECACACAAFQLRPSTPPRVYCRYLVAPLSSAQPLPAILIPTSSYCDVHCDR